MHTCTHTHAHMHAHTCTHTHARTHRHRQTQTHRHTRLHSQTPSLLFLQWLCLGLSVDAPQQRVAHPAGVDKGHHLHHVQPADHCVAVHCGHVCCCILLSPLYHRGLAHHHLQVQTSNNGTRLSSPGNQHISLAPRVNFPGTHTHSHSHTLSLKQQLSRSLTQQRLSLTRSLALLFSFLLFPV